jgi:glycosyltransferase involved in cell wall biosynthesis
MLGVPVDSTVITFVGRLTRIKRGERFIELARRLRPDFVDAVFVVVGDGPEREMLQRSAEGLDNVVFAGWQSDMAQVYAASDLLVLTSDNEGMPVALIEGAMQGVPAVATDVGAVRQVIADGETGVVVREVDGLTQAVRTLIGDDAQRRQMGAAAAMRARSLFGEHRLVSDYAALYERLIATSPKRRLRRRL